jgi:hypothetical protein
MLGLAGVCTTCCVLLALAVIGSSSSTWSGLNGQVCAGLETTPSLKVGIAWYLPISSYLPPLMGSPYKVCFVIPLPLAARLPSMAGEWVFPP